MALTPGTLDGYLGDFATYVDASNWDAAEAELVKAEAVLQALPDTDKARWAGQLQACWKMLQTLRDRSQTTAGVLVFGALRRKTRSTRSDET
jgi:hypothetical protein